MKRSTSEMERTMQRLLQRRMRYGDEEMQQFLNMPGNRKMLASLGRMGRQRLVVEVLEARGCFCRHTSGQEFVFGMDGALRTRESPESLCIHLLSPAAAFVQAAQELLMAGLDPATMAFTRYGCFDVGVGCGGLGKVVCKVRVEQLDE